MAQTQSELPDVIVYGANMGDLVNALRRSGFRVRPVDHLVGLLDEILRCIREFGVHDRHAVLCDVRQDEESAVTLMRIRRTTMWHAPIVLFADGESPLLDAAAAIPDVHVAVDASEAERVLRSLEA